MSQFASFGMYLEALRILPDPKSFFLVFFRNNVKLKIAKVINQSYNTLEQQKSSTVVIIAYFERMIESFFRLLFTIIRFT